MLFYLIRRADRHSKPVTAAQRRQAKVLTWVLAFVIVAIVLVLAG